MERYDLNQLAVITGLTTRTLRNYLNQDLLKGEKMDGVWSFTEAEVEAFLEHPDVRRMLATKQNALVYDFLADTYKKTNRLCVILDCPVERAEAAEISEFFCRTITEIGHDIEFNQIGEKHYTRVILSGAEDMVVELMQRYYGRFPR